MADPSQPNLGYGKQSEATIDQVNIWMRSTPWYQAQMRSWGQDPGHPTLSGSQSQQILRMAQANGVVVDQGNMEIDDHGNFNPIGHKLRNTLIVGGLAAAAIAAPYAIGALTHGAGAAGGLSGVEAGATAGLGATALPGAMATLPALGAAAPLAAGAWDAAGNFLGPSSVTAAASGASMSEFAKALLKAAGIAAPAALALAKPSSSTNAASSPFTPTMQQQLEQLLGLQTDRSARTAPIHQAAMAMASRMAPGYAQSAMTGTPTGTPSPTPSLPQPPALPSVPSPDSLTPAQLEALKRLLLGSKLPKPPDPFPADPSDPANAFASLDPGKLY